jgi:hypothetical protein
MSSKAIITIIIIDCCYGIVISHAWHWYLEMLPLGYDMAVAVWFVVFL